jgi:hypothetical protein
MLPSYVKYTMKEGEHYSLHNFHEMRARFLSFNVVFDESCKYEIEGEDQADVNKLFGFSECDQQHHENSARFGWDWNKSAGITIHAYVYNNSVRTSTQIAKVKLGTEHSYRIDFDDENYYFTIDGLVDRFPMKRTHKCTTGIYYILYPYFGGNQPAPHNMHIYMKRLY